MSEASELRRCTACNGRGYHHCECWPGDCICGWDDGDCEECRGEGWIDPSYDDNEDWEMRQMARNAGEPG